jgi:hypothetical protein
MGICKDSSIEYLKRLGYNVVRHPREGIAPLALVGRQNRTVADLGSLDDVFVQPAPAAPTAVKDLQAAGVNGEESNKLDLSLGVSILGNLIGAMGGNLGIDTGYTNADKISFVYESVLSDRVEPTDIDRFLTQGQINFNSPLMNEYVLGNGNLYVITDTIKSTHFTVKFESSSGIEANVDVPVIEQVVGAKIGISASNEAKGTVTFKGDVPLVFGFRCLELGVLDGQLRLTLSKPGAVTLSLAEKVADDDFAVLNGANDGLLDLDAAA